MITKNELQISQADQGRTRTSYELFERMAVTFHWRAWDNNQPCPEVARAPGLAIPGTGMSWRFAGHSHIYKAIQAQSDIKAVHAQGTVKAVQAQAEIIGIAKRMETVAKRLTRNAAGGTCWRKAAIEQAGLLDKMLDVAKASENEQLIASVRKVFNGWAEGHREYRAALDSGRTISECLGRQSTCTKRIRHFVE
jgi:hypothetical protein